MTLTRFGGWDFYVARGGKPLGLVLIHEIYGFNAYMETVARNLAAQGFSVAAIDLFRGKKAASLEEGYKLRGSVTKDLLEEGVSKGIEMLRLESRAKKFGTMGFCMGGGFALQSACDLGVDFCVDYYGMIENAEDASRLRCPVLLVLASDDERVTPWAFASFLPAAMKYKERVEVQLYPNTRHAFHRPNWEGHDPDAAKDAFEKTVRFLSQVAGN